MEVGVRNVNWMLVGAWTTGSTIKKNVHDRHKIHVISFYIHRGKKRAHRRGHFSLKLYYNFIYAML